MLHTRIILSFIITGLCNFAVHSAKAAQLQPVEVQCDDEMFKGKSRYSENLSGVSCSLSGPEQWDCFVVADERVGLQRFSLSHNFNGSYTCRPGRIIARNKGFSCLKGKKAERDFEGIARSGDDLYITGSWGNRRKSNVGTAPERWVFLRQPLRNNGAPKKRCQALKRRDLLDFIKYHGAKLSKFRDFPLQCGGLNIEGLAVRGRQVFFGFRSPSDIPGNKAFVLEADLTGMFSGNAKTTLHSLSLGKGAGIRAMDTLPDGRILIVSGDAGVKWNNLSRKSYNKVEAICGEPSAPLYQNRPVQNLPRFWLWSPDTGELKSLGTAKDLPYMKKLEGVAVLSVRGNSLNVLAVYDDVEYQPFVVFELQF